jgi:octaprenyl-diphosphate synthase
MSESVLVTSAPHPRPRPADTPALRAFLDAVDDTMATIVKDAAALQEVEVPGRSWQGGKRIRPRVVYECSLSLGVAPEEAVTLAAVTELIHAASLAHDDVIDEAVVRRGQPSLRATSGNRTAVLLGDLIFSAAWARAIDDLPGRAVSLLADAMTRMAGAEIREDELMWNAETDWRTCLRVIDGKTAALFASSAAGVATLAGASADAVAALGRCGQAIGRAFQILDDVQDYAPLRGGWGKEPLKDLKEGVASLPLVVALRRGDGPAAFQVRRYLAGRGEVPLDALPVHALLEETSAAAVCLRLARRFCRQSLAATEPYVRTDGLQRLVEALLAGLRDTVER